MTELDYEDEWYRYWERTHGGNRRLEIENAAEDPLGRWVTARLPDLVDDEVGMDAATIRDHPDEVFRSSRAAFASFVEDHDDVDAAGEGYEFLPVHLAGVGRSTDPPFGLGSPLEDANTVAHLPNARTTEAPRNRTRSAELTYRCPSGHETTIRQPLHRSWTLDTCGEEGCSNEVVLDDSATKARRVAHFTVETASGKFQCVATGKYAGRTEDAKRFMEADSLHLTGIPRLIADSNGAVQTVFEILAIEPR